MHHIIWPKIQKLRLVVWVKPFETMVVESQMTLGSSCATLDDGVRFMDAQAEEQELLKQLQERLCSHVDQSNNGNPRLLYLYK